MPLQLEISQGTINLPIENYKGISLSLSGGIDSATLLYLMAEYIYNNNLDTKIYAITIPNKTDSACAYHASLVIDFIKKRFPIDIEHIIRATIQDGGFKTEAIKRIERELIQSKKITCIMNGVTANPPDDSNFKWRPPNGKYVKPRPEREREIAVTYTQNSGIDIYFPFAKFDKQGICEITKLKNITTRLLLMTKSCTNAIYYQCGECWWCCERAWGFDIKYRTHTKRIKFQYCNSHLDDIPSKGK